MIISIIIILGCFIAVIILIITNKLNRAISSLLGAVITYFVLIFIEGLDFSIIVDLLFGSPSEGFVNLHSIILIIGMMMIVQIAHEVGTFQFIAVKLIKLSGGKPIPLMIIFCSVTVLISAILNNILTVIIIIPLTITVSRMLNINPSPYILTQAVLANEKLDVVKARENLAKKQLIYLKVAQAQASEEKILKAKNNAEKQKKGLIKQKNDVLEAEKILRKRENKLADLKKEFSLKLAEREKIRHPGVMVAG